MPRIWPNTSASVIPGVAMRPREAIPAPHRPRRIGRFSSSGRAACDFRTCVSVCPPASACSARCWILAFSRCGRCCCCLALRLRSRELPPECCSSLRRPSSCDVPQQTGARQTRQARHRRRGRRAKQHAARTRVRARPQASFSARHACAWAATGEMLHGGQRARAPPPYPSQGHHGWAASTRSSH